MRGNAIFMYHIVEYKILGGDEDTEFSQSSEYIHRTYKQALDELNSKGYEFKTTYDNGIEHFHKEPTNYRKQSLRRGNEVCEAYIERLTLMKDGLNKEERI